MGKWLYKRLRYMFSALLEIIYSEEGVCFICGCHIEEAYPFCKSCRNYLPYLESTILHYDNICLKKVYSIFSFEGKIKEMIYDLKYNKRIELACIIGDVLADFIETSGIKVDVIIPIPTHKDKILDRGYDHIYLIAKRIGRVTGIKIDTSLKKINNTSPQVLLSGKERWYNVRDSFMGDVPYSNKNILLIDDVVTTCATGHFSALELGNNNVELLTLASTKKF